MSGCKACSHTYMLARLHSGACTRMRALMRNTGCGCRNSYGAGAVSWGSPVCHSRRVAACPLRPSRVRVRKSVLSVDDVAVPGCAVAGGRWGAFCPTACPGSGDWSPVCELSCRAVRPGGRSAVPIQSETVDTCQRARPAQARPSGFARARGGSAKLVIT